MKGEEFKDDFRKSLPRELVQRLTQRSAWRATLPILGTLRRSPSYRSFLGLEA